MVKKFNVSNKIIDSVLFFNRKRLMNKYINELKKEQGAKVVIGGFWGNEGKSKIAFELSQNADLIIKASNGNNTINSVVFNGKKINLQYIPCGIIYPNTKCLIGQGMSIDLKVLKEEIEMLEKIGVVDVRKRLYISSRANIEILYFQILNQLFEQIKSQPWNNDKKEISHMYFNKYNHIKFKMYDLFIDPNVIEKKIGLIFNFYQVIVNEYLFDKKFNANEIVRDLLKYKEFYKDFLVDADKLTESVRRQYGKIVVEDSHTYCLNIETDNYFNKSKSDYITNRILMDAHLNHKDVKEVILVVKAYCSKYGIGMFPTEQVSHVKNGEVTAYKVPFVGDVIRDEGNEYCLEKENPRRTGWFDAVLVRSAKDILGVDYLCISHIDTIGKIGKILGEIRICYAYKYNDEIINYFPDDIEITGEFPIPVYKKLLFGWEISPNVNDYNDLPDEAKEFINHIENYTGIPVKYVGIGADKNNLIVRNVFER